MPQTESPSKAYAGSRYFREFVTKIRKDPDAGRYEHLEDYPYDILVDQKLGLRLYHAGINPYDHDHFRHQIYIVTMDSPEGKTNRLFPAETVVATCLTLQWTKRGDLCNALLLSIKAFGQCTFAWCGDSPSSSKCGWCGHNQRTLLWRGDKWKWSTYRRGRALQQGERHCCRWNNLIRRYECCRCKDPANALMSPLDREDAATMPQSVLPATLEGHRLYMNNRQTTLVRADPVAPTTAVTNNGAGQPTVNNIHIYGNIYHTAATGSGGPTSIIPGYLLLAAPLSIECVPRAMIGFTSGTAPSVQPLGGVEGGRIVEEMDDEPGASRSCARKPRKYAKPMVEDDVDDNGKGTDGLATMLSRLDMARTSA